MLPMTSPDRAPRRTRFRFHRRKERAQPAEPAGEQPVTVPALRDAEPLFRSSSGSVSRSKIVTRSKCALSTRAASSPAMLRPMTDGVMPVIATWRRDGVHWNLDFLAIGIAGRPITNDRRYGGSRGSVIWGEVRKT